MRPRRGEKTEPWLLIKADDEFARQAGEPDITDEETTSFLSGRTTGELAAVGELRKDHAGRAKVIGARKQPLPDPASIDGARKGILPAFLEPSLPQLTDKAAERREMGARDQVRRLPHRRRASTAAKVRLLTRQGLDWTARFPSIAAALPKLGLELRADRRRDRRRG